MELVLSTLSSEGSLAELLEELSHVEWYITELSEVRRTSEGFKALNKRHILCYQRHEERKQIRVGSGSS